ncbi:serine/threonine protein kinase [Leptolinea tardivitalis]|nr:serine/threonine protein kinase [Leptolinea tardivitalis]
MAFSSNFLKLGSVESDLWGFPRVRSGGFALTYKVDINEMTWAARCFHRGVRDRAIRYAQICQAIEKYQLPFFVPTRYIQHGITVHGKQFPISVLEWVEGESLESYIFHHLESQKDLITIGQKFRQVCRLMEEKELAHGDLSHRNILVKSDEIVLIDYDGMFVPALTGRKSSELGNTHFQHPERSNSFFNCRMDRFSSIVIYLAIMALASDPALWNRFQSGGEGLLFQKSDFLDPGKSRLLLALENNPGVSRYISQFRQICTSSIESVPSLEELIEGTSVKPVKISSLFDSRKKQKVEIPVIFAESLDEIYKKEGEIVTVVGRIIEIFHGHTINGEDHIFLNFGDWQEDCFTVVLWGSVLDDINRMDISVDSWIGRWVSINGLISVRKRRPQIQAEALTDITILPSQENANLLLNSYTNSKWSQIEKKKVEKESAEKGSNQVIQNHEAPKINLIDMFHYSEQKNVDSLLNQLYSSNRFNNINK